MKKSTLLTGTMMICIFLSITVQTNAQNTTITDSATYLPHSSAMLDVMSNSKGMLVPRMTTAQRVAISNPANGLLVFDVTEGSFFFYNNSTWHNLSQTNGNIWNISGNNVFLADSNYKVGVGTSNPTAGLTVAGSPASTVNDTLFIVRNKNGEPVFAVFPEGVRVWVEDGAKGNIGGFAVSGRASGKNIYDLLSVSTDSVRIYINDTAAKGNIGGFAVSGRASGKTIGKEFLHVTPDSTRIYIEESSKGNIGGFAVSGRASGKSIISDFLRVTPDSTRIYTQDTIKGFGVGSRDAGGSIKQYVRLMPKNYFIGHESGLKNESGQFNSFIGYQSGYHNLSGSRNYFLGYRAGYSNTSGYINIFMGDSTGFYNSTGRWNVFLGDRAGFKNVDGYSNVYIGKEAGFSNSGGWGNVALGYQALYQNLSYNNVAIGSAVLSKNTYGNHNISIGTLNLTNNTIGHENIAIGHWTSYNQDTGNFNIAIGHWTAYNNKGGCNTAIGGMSLCENRGDFNTAVGWKSLTGNKSGINNTVIGVLSLFRNKSGNENVAVGYAALADNRTGSNNVAVGSYSFNLSMSGTKNTAVGYYSFLGFELSDTAHINSTAIGAYAPMNASNKIRLGDANITVIEGQVAYTIPSDGRFKENVSENVKGLDFINKLRPVTYNFNTRKYDAFLMKNAPDSLKNRKFNETDYSKSSSIVQSGFIAQEVEKAAFESGYNFNGVNKPANDNDYYSMAYSLLTVPLVKAVQELSSKNEELQQQNREIQKQNKEMQKQILELKAAIDKLQNK